MKRVNTRGIKQANKCMLMAAVAYNIKKMMKFNIQRPMAAVVSLRKESSDLVNTFVFYLKNLLSATESKISV